jgi:hypothetical protein
VLSSLDSKVFKLLDIIRSVAFHLHEINDTLLFLVELPDLLSYRPFFLHLLSHSHLSGLVLPLKESSLFLGGVVPNDSFKHLHAILVLLKRNFLYLRNSSLLLPFDKLVELMQKITASLLFAHFMRNILRPNEFRDHLERELDLVMIHDFSEIVQSIDHSVMDIS